MIYIRTTYLLCYRVWIDARSTQRRRSPPPNEKLLPGTIPVVSFRGNNLPPVRGSTHIIVSQYPAHTIPPRPPPPLTCRAIPPTQQKTATRYDTWSHFRGNSLPPVRGLLRCPTITSPTRAPCKRKYAAPGRRSGALDVTRSHAMNQPGPMRMNVVNNCGHQVYFYLKTNLNIARNG